MLICEGCLSLNGTSSLLVCCFLLLLQETSTLEYQYVLYLANFERGGRRVQDVALRARSGNVGGEGAAGWRQSNGDEGAVAVRGPQLRVGVGGEEAAIASGRWW
jgi:hypothetical protein